MNRVLLSECAQCGAEMIAPRWSEHLSDRCVRNVWSCEACGYQFEDLVYVSAQATESFGTGLGINYGREHL
jgi:ribosomal protein L37AE/L43A